MSHPRHGFSAPLRQVLAALALVTAGLVICVFASCGPTAQQRYEQQLAKTGTPALHAVQSERLRELMGGLTYGMSLDPPDRFTEPARRAKQVAEVAGQMAATARDVAAAEKEFKLTEKDREVFLNLAEKLRTSAQAISDAAAGQDYEGTRQAISRMQSTCNACHSLYRVEPGMMK